MVEHLRMPRLFCVWISDILSWFPFLKRVLKKILPYFINVGKLDLTEDPEPEHRALSSMKAGAPPGRTLSTMRGQSTLAEQVSVSGSA